MHRREGLQKVSFSLDYLLEDFLLNNEDLICQVGFIKGSCDDISMTFGYSENSFEIHFLVAEIFSIGGDTSEYDSWFRVETH